MISYIVYGKDNCPNCDRAVGLLKMKGASFTVKKFGVDYSLDELADVAGRQVRAMPFIMSVDEDTRELTRIGGIDSLVEALVS